MSIVFVLLAVVTLALVFTLVWKERSERLDPRDLGVVEITAPRQFSLYPRAVVYVYSQGCAFCSKFMPEFQALPKQFPHIKFLTCRADSLAASSIGVTLIPTVVCMRSGVEVARVEGYKPQDVTAALERVL